MALRAVSYNIQYGMGRDGRVDLERIAAAVQEADIIGLQEVDRFAPRSGDLDQPTVLGTLLSGTYWVYGPTVDLLAKHRPVGGERRQFGNMVLSRWPVLSSRLLLYVPKIGGQNHLSVQLGCLEATIDAPGRPLRVYVTHLHHLSPTLRSWQIGQLLRFVREAPNEGSVVSGADQDPSWLEGIASLPVPPDALLLGDFNLTPDSANYGEIVGPLHPRSGTRLTAVDGVADAWVLAGHGEGDGITFPDPTRPGEARRLDYIFVTAGLVRGVCRSWIDGEAAGSDHQPVWAEIDLSGVT